MLKYLFKKLLKLLLNPVFYRMMGFMSLSLFVMMAGPLIGFGDARPLESLLVRYLVVGAFGALLVAPVLIKIITVRFRSKHLLDTLMTSVKQASQPVSSSVSASISSSEQAMMESFQEGLEALQASTHRKAFYQLPWYVMIGPAGVGKTTALNNSGLSFPLRKRLGDIAFRGASGTRNCDWILTDQAVVIDTAGRYCSQDSNQQADAAEWSRFLTQIRRHRRRVLNGVIVAIGIDSIVKASDGQQMDDAFNIQQRLKEVHATLKYQLPVYFVLTKMDLVEGFDAFYDHFSRQERKQVWGITAEQAQYGHTSEFLDSFSDALDALLARLNQQVIRLMHQEQDPNKRLQIFNFPQQFASYQHQVAEFVRSTFGLCYTRTETLPWLRGVYFTSGTQLGYSLDSLVDRIAKSVL